MDDDHRAKLHDIVAKSRAVMLLSQGATGHELETRPGDEEKIDFRR